MLYSIQALVYALVDVLPMRLLARNGPLAGGVLTLTDGLTLSGPDDGRPLCRFRTSGNGGFDVEALADEASVFVNGLPVATPAPVRIQARDELRIGDSQFVVRAAEDVSNSGLSPCPVEIRLPSPPRSVFQLGFDDALLSRDVPAAARDSRDLATLLRAAAALSSIRGLAQFDAAIAGLVMDAVPACRVALSGAPGEPPVVRSAWSAPGATVEPLPVDVALLERAARERAALVVEIDGRHAAAAPLMAFGRAVGSIWLEAPAGSSFDESHMRLLLVVAALAAVAREQWGEAERLLDRNEQLRSEINLEHNMVGTSRLMRALFERIARVARTDSTILLRGESGTGKELVARAAHRNSSRADRPFIAINCAALTETLLESELFGHEKGAFTGAIGLKKGKMELADGGTLFLDEIGELPLSLQAKLLRALQEREFERVGGTRPVRVDFRLIAATNSDLEGAVRAGGFRQDLYYRLNVVSLVLPPLRERREDIPLLAEYFVRKHAPRSGRRVDAVEPEALSRLSRHDWPGNVRELENAIEQALALGVSDCITAEDLPANLLAQPSTRQPSSLNYHETVEGTKRDLILRAFEEAEQNHSAAARLLGVHPNYLHRLVRNFDLRRGDERR
jgi:two-component system, NtrC family, response regulator HydG